MFVVILNVDEANVPTSQSPYLGISFFGNATKSAAFKPPPPPPRSKISQQQQVDITASQDSDQKFF